MRGEFRGTLVGALGLLAGVLGACHDGEYVRSVHATAVFDEAALDFGEVPVGEWREREITVRNVGYVPFTLVEALELQDHPSFHIEAAQQTVPSGQTRTVKVRFHPLKEGELLTDVKVETDARIRPEDPVKIRGFGTPARIVVEPRELNFETLEIDSDRTLEVSIQNPVDIPITVELEGPDRLEFGADAVTIPPFTTTRLKATFAPRSVGDRLANLKVSACPDCTPTRVNMAGRSVPHAFAFEPAPIPFQETPVHETSSSFTKMTNVTWRPVQLRELLTSDSAFTTMADFRDRVLQPGETVQVDMQFAARFSGPNMGHMDVNYTSDKSRQARVEIDARGGQPQLALTPISIDFGSIPVGSKLEQTVRLTNAGSNGDLHFQGVRAEGMTEHFSVGAPTKGTQTFAWSGGAWPNLTAPDVPIAPGADYADVKVFFNPTAPGAFEARLIFRSDAPFTPEREVLVKGSAVETGACQWRMVPWPELNFGNVPPNTEAILGFRFENAATNICAVKDIHISNDGGGVFSMPGGSLTGGSVPQDSAFSAMIRFSSAAAGNFTGELSITVNDPANPVIRLPLRAIAAPSCLVATPHPVDFGPIRYDCDPQPKVVYVANACATPVTVTGMEIGPGTSTQYAIAAPQPAMPRTLNPGDGFEIGLTYSRTVLGQHYSPLWIHTLGDPAPYTVPLWAETNHEGTAVDRFVQGQAKQLDVLFVVSNTTTSQPFQQKLQNAIPGWIATAQQQGMNLQVGVTTTGLVSRGPTCGGGANGGEAGRLFPVDGTRERVVSGTAARVSTIQQNINVGLCHNLPQGLETMRMALSAPLISSTDDPRTPQPNDGNAGFMRAPARLAVVFVADEDDHSGFDPSSYVQFLRELKGPNMSHRVQAYGFLPDGSCQTAGPSGARYQEVINQTGGASLSVCASSYSNLLAQILARASGPQADFKLSFPASDASQITVRVDGTEVPRGDWTYDAADNTVVFNSGATPAPGQVIEVRYVSECGTVTK